MAITTQQALECFASDDLIGIGMEADAVRRALHPEGTVTYVVDRTLCCTAPSFQQQVAEAVDLGATAITLRATLTPATTLDWFESLLSNTQAHSPALVLHGLDSTTAGALGALSGTSVEEALTRLQSAGLQLLDGSDACLGDASWFATHRAAHRLGLASTAALRIGYGESAADRVAHLDAIRSLQDETGGFTSFTLFTAPLPPTEAPTAVEYLKTLAIARMILDNVPHVEADWATQGLKLLQMALRFGADDVGSTMPRDSAVSPDGTTEEDLRRVIRGAGLRPVQRDALCRVCYLT